MSLSLLRTLALGALLLFISACSGESTSYTPCTDDSTCDQGMICMDGQCQPTPSCASDDDCQGGRICQQGFCVTAECNEDGDCSADQHCEEHKCVEGAPCNCSTDADCAPDEFCKDDCQCQTKEETTCTTDGDCAANELCIENKCGLAPSCSADLDCPTGTICESGRCSRPCSQDSDCSSQMQTCVDGHCLNRCINDANCSGGDICENNVCVDPQCVQDSDCSGELIRCHNGRCESYTPCTDDSDCEPAYECLNEICEERPLCSIDQDCWDQGLENTSCKDGHCLDVASCETEDDCDVSEDCIGGLCLTHYCRGQSDCPEDKICVEGQCQNPDPGDTVYEVVILNPGGPIHQGAGMQLQAIALTQSGNELPGVDISWSSSAPNAVGIDAQSGYATGGDTAGDSEITARAVTADVTSDPIVLTNVLSPQADSMYVTVIDELRRTPLADATVMITDGESPQTSITDSDGMATFTAPSGAADVHVFADAHDYVSIMNTTSTDILVAVPEKTANASAGGYTGQMTYEGIGALSMGLAGTSIAGNLVDMDFASLLGEVFYVSIPQLGSIPMPSQMVAELTFMGQDFPLKDTYYVLGQKGLRTAWCLGGKLDDQILWDLMGGGGSVNIEDVIVGLLPYFSLLRHGLKPLVDVFPYPLVQDTDDIDNDGDTAEYRADWASMLDLDMAPATGQNFSVQVSVPPLPMHNGQAMRTAVYVTGVLTPLGFTPLGMSAGQDDSGQLPALLMKMAPSYGGLETSDYAVMVMGFPQTTQNQTVTDLTSVLMVSDSMPTNVSFDNSFLGFPDSAAYDASSRTMTSSAVSGASLYRTTLRASEGSWVVYQDGQDTISFTLPTPPGGMYDPAQDPVVTLNPIALGDALGFEDLVTFNGEDLDMISRLAVAFSRFQL